jgi:uncharacterized YccA/Bax inhibitor family protein
MLRSSNPILSKQDAFTPAAPQYGQNQYGRSPYNQYPPEAYGQPAPVQQAPEGLMTFDDVITKTAVTWVCSPSRRAWPGSSCPRPSTSPR